jgi:hypothetical protein
MAHYDNTKFDINNNSIEINTKKSTKVPDESTTPATSTTTTTTTSTSSSTTTTKPASSTTTSTTSGEKLIFAGDGNEAGENENENESEVGNQQHFDPLLVYSAAKPTNTEPQLDPGLFEYQFFRPFDLNQNFEIDFSTCEFQF